MGALKKVPGFRSGLLTVIERVAAHGGSQVTHLKCRCDCGRISVVHVRNVGGHTRSCGCGQHKGTHGMTDTPTYRSWEHMRGRCGNPAFAQFADYGGRGITVCARWETSFENFLADMGERPAGKTIDRIDNSKGYEPGNCRWATPAEQNRNSRRNVLLTVDGLTACLTDHARRYGMHVGTVKHRIKTLGWTPERALRTVASRGRRPA